MLCVKHLKLLLQGGADILPLRLRNTLLRILNRSLVKFRPSYIPASSWERLLQHGVASGPSNTSLQPPSPDGQASKVKELISPFSKSAAAGDPEGATALSNPGNLYGLQVCSCSFSVFLANILPSSQDFHVAADLFAVALLARQLLQTLSIFS